MRIRIRNKRSHTMVKAGLREPRQARSQQTLERILSSSTTLISERSYDEVPMTEIAECAQISIGGFYSRFENKEALFASLLSRLEQETQEMIDAALAIDWSRTSLHELLRFIVAGNAELYDKYRGILATLYLKTRALDSLKNDKARQVYNENIVSQLEVLLLRKRHQILRRQPKVAIRLAVTCMASMLRDAIVFGDTSLYPKPGDARTVTRHVATIMHLYLTAELS